MKPRSVLCVGLAAIMAALFTSDMLKAQENEEFDAALDAPDELVAPDDFVVEEAGMPDEQVEFLETAIQVEPEYIPAESPQEAELQEIELLEEPAPVAEPELLEEPAPVAELELELFDDDIDRSIPVDSRVGIEPEAASSAPPAPKRSFWGSLLGTKTAAEPTQPQTIPASESMLEAKELTPEQALANQEKARREAAEIEAQFFFKAADQDRKNGDYAAAVAKLLRGIQKMPSRPQTLAIIEDAKRKHAECEYRIAQDHHRAGNLIEAKEAIRRAQIAYPADRRAAKLADKIAAQEQVATERALKPMHPKKTEEFVNKKQKLQAAIKRGRQYMEIKDYERAKYEFRAVQIEDPENEDAIYGLKQIAERQYDTATDRLAAFKQQMIVDVVDAWTPPVRQEIATPSVSVGESEGIISVRRRRLLNKLNTTVIPQLEFRQANIVDVIDYLKQQSIAGDTVSTVASEKGVNLILNLRRSAEAEPFESIPPPLDADPFAPPMSDKLPTARGIPSITLSLNNILLIDAIKYITEVTGLKYRIEDDVVVITPADVVYGDVKTKTYRVQPTIQEIFMSSGAPSTEGAHLQFDLGVETRGERGDIKSFFVEAGVPFPEGTSILYKQSLNLLIVSNTEENLEKLERILATLDVIPKQVEIEARFVEIGQKDLMELGFEWNLTDNWLIAQQAGAGAAVPLSARERVQVNKNIFSKGLRTLDSGGSPASGGDLAGILSISSILTNPELNFILHALEQRSGVNLLSAPKVTTKSGANAEIKVAKELIYPTEYETIEAPVPAGYTGITPRYTVPSTFETRDVGVVLNVTPIVAPDGYTIDLTMLPQVVELTDWINYGSTVTREDGSSEQINIMQPVFHSRTIATSISIWDGQTVVMGGLITEAQTTTEDKIPFLGDIPLLGYLFRSQTKMSEKRNLLIFVTARLMDLAGNKAQTETAGPLTFESR